MQTCQVCGKQNPTGVDYCEDCGAALTQTPQPVPVGTASGAAAGTAPASASTPQPTPPPAAGPADATAAPAPAAPAPADPTAPAGSAAPTAGSDLTPPAPEGVGAAGETTAPAPAAPAAPAADAGPIAPRARLIVKRFGAPTGEEIALLGERLVVGRFDPETGPVDIDLSASQESVHISRQHGELYREADGRWFVRDLGSTNGIFVKSQTAVGFGPRITAPQPLADGDEVAFGNARFLFRTA
jgi:hypothetical protein